MNTKFSWVSLVSLVGTTLLTTFTPYLQHEVSIHPMVLTVLAGAWGVIGHLLSPPSGTPAAR